MGAAVFVIDGHDIDLYEDAEDAAREIEGYDAMSLDYFGADGTVYVATVEGPEWGPVALHPTQENRLGDLVRLLRAEAEDRGLSLPPATPDQPEAIWGALLAAQQEQQGRRRSRHRWWRRKKQGLSMAVVAGGVPGLPIRLLWDDLDRTYASLSELGIDLEFVLEREYLAPEDPKPVFTDSGGSRLRILVLSLEVVLCVRVPDEYDPSDLKLVSFEQQGLEMVVEVYGAQAHRALSREIGGTELFVAVAPEELEVQTAPLRLDSLPASTLSWLEFDEAWLTCVDPAPPIRIRELFSRLLRRGRGHPLLRGGDRTVLFKVGSSTLTARTHSRRTYATRWPRFLLHQRVTVMDSPVGGPFLTVTRDEPLWPGRVPSRF